MKAILTALALAALTGAARAQDYHLTPDGNGGFYMQQEIDMSALKESICGEVWGAVASAELYYGVVPSEAVPVPEPHAAEMIEQARKRKIDQLTGNGIIKFDYWKDCAEHNRRMAELERREGKPLTPGFDPPTSEPAALAPAPAAAPKGDQVGANAPLAVPPPRSKTEPAPGGLY